MSVATGGVIGDRCAGRVVVVTGAGRGLGRAHALELARHGAVVVVNDLDPGVPGGSPPAADVVSEIEALGGTAVADAHDVADWEGAEQVIAETVARFGQLDAVVNNAGILRDRSLVNMDITEWDDVVRVHLRSTFCMSRWAAVHWRDRSKAAGAGPVRGRLVNTTSGAGLYGNFGQVNYGAAKAGIASFTAIAAMELTRYGVTVNAICPAALTRMTEDLLSPERAALLAPERVSPLVAWLVSAASDDINGQVFNVAGTHLSVAEGWSAGPGTDGTATWTLDDLDELVPDLVDRAAPRADLQGRLPSATTVGTGS